MFLIERAIQVHRRSGKDEAALWTALGHGFGCLSLCMHSAPRRTPHGRPGTVRPFEAAGCSAEVCWEHEICRSR